MTDKLRQAAQQILEAVADLTILTPREWQAVHGLKINALRAALAEQPAEQGPVAWFDADGKIHGRVSKEQLVALCTEALTQLGERYVALADYKELQALASRQGIRLMEYESQPIEPAEQEPGNWSVYNSGAEVASGLSFAEAREYLTPERLARKWCAVCVVDQSNLPTAPQPAKRQPLTDEEIDAARGAT